MSTTDHVPLPAWTRVPPPLASELPPGPEWKAEPECTVYVPMTKHFVEHFRTTQELLPSQFDSLKHLDTAGAGVPLFKQPQIALLMLHVCRRNGPSDSSRSTPSWNEDTPDTARTQTLPMMHAAGHVSNQGCNECLESDAEHGREDGILQIEFRPTYWAMLLSQPVLVQRKYRAAPHWLLQCPLPLVHPHIRYSLAFAHLSSTQCLHQTVLDVRTKFQADSESDIMAQALDRNATIQLNIAALEAELHRNLNTIRVSSGRMAAPGCS